ncbi:MAG: peptide ABC transporter substrate-binding protein, partial [Chloroflexota bacterium]|nr:peptide ABC transporter substrate-binding protein [Chloroflexota bacterium]
VEQLLDEEGNPRIVNAHDVEYAVKRTVDPATASDYAYVLYTIKNGEAINTGEEPDIDTLGVKAVDDYTVEFTLEYPAGFFPAIASMWVCRPVPKDVIERVGERWIEPGFIVTNGPYVMAEWAHDDHMTLVKNPYYWDADKVQIERQELPIITESSTNMAMYEANEIDMAADPGHGVPLEDMDRVKADPVLSKELLIAPRLCTYYYGFTNNKPPFDDVLVRKAFSAAIDRKSLVEEVTKGGQQPANTFACPGIFGNAAFDPDIATWAVPEEKGGWGYEKAVEQAKAWLAEAGYPGGEGFPKVTLMHNTSEGHRRIAEAISAMWRDALGVDVEVADQEWKVYLKTIKKDTPLEDMPHIWRLGWCADYPDQNNWVHEVFNATAGANRLRRHCVDPICSEIEEAEFDELTRAAGMEPDPAKRVEMYRRAEKILSDEECAFAPIYYYTRVCLTKPWLHRTYSPLGLGHVHLWTIDWEAKKAATGIE